MERREQFDEYLGGDQSLPSEVHIMKLVSSRASEIAAMTYSIENPQMTKLVFQKLPIYMRRRVMSHNAKRLPRRLREAHLNQMAKSGLPPKSKRPSRKYRRRPRNLLAEYTRRQRSKVWLETHIWHAKRFHMTEKWGYRLANFANDKCFKANYRAVARHCLIQDLSYYNCVEITGPEDVLRDTLTCHCNRNELTFGARIYTKGDREGTVLFFKKNGYPWGAIGHVHFLWRPGQDGPRTIWIWVHPSVVGEILEEITTSFEFKADSINVDQTTRGNTVYVNDKDCKMTILRNALNRFRLYGPSAISVLTKSLRLPSIDEGSTLKKHSAMEIEIDESAGNVEKNESMEVEEATDKEAWYTEYYRNRETLESLETQTRMWQVLRALDSPGQLPLNIVLAFTVLDPRFFLPLKRTRPVKEKDTIRAVSSPPAGSNQSPLWDSSVRQRVTQSWVSNGTINKLRGKRLVPGADGDKHFSEGIMAKIPILLVQKPGRDNSGLGASVDIILPAGWAMAFWLAFIYRCARVGALRESRSVAFETSDTKSPDINDPDTKAYERESTELRTELTAKYFRYPPNRRVNFVKVGIASPFFCDWRLLMREWAETDDFFVLRDRQLLGLLQRKVSSNGNQNKRNKSDEISDTELRSKFDQKNCLVRVKVSILKRGCPKRFAIICLPTSEDIQKFDGNRNWSGPVEKRYPDPNETTRKRLRKDHSILLKRLQRQRIRRRKAILNKMSATLKSNPQALYELTKKEKQSAPTQSIVKEYAEKMSNLYLPECKKVRYSCDREVTGYLTAADFSFREAKGIGIGYVVLDALFQLMSQRNKFVLVRNTQTRQYRTAKLEVLF